MKQVIFFSLVIIIALSSCTNVEKKFVAMPDIYHQGYDTTITSNHQKFVKKSYTKNVCGKQVSGKYWTPDGYENTSTATQKQGEKVSSDEFNFWLNSTEKNKSSCFSWKDLFYLLGWIALLLLILALAIALWGWIRRQLRRDNYIVTTNNNPISHQRVNTTNHGPIDKEGLNTVRDLVESIKRDGYNSIVDVPNHYIEIRKNN